MLKEINLTKSDLQRILEVIKIQNKEKNKHCWHSIERKPMGLQLLNYKTLSKTQTVNNILTIIKKHA